MSVTLSSILSVVCRRLSVSY